ncbi:MAG TPA: fatty acid desaturase [Gemmataceae bacterium]|nr:fatty acid desaturase [Gemmataceae bacterium]
MTPALARPVPRGLFRQSPWDALPVALAAGHGALLLLAPAAPLVAVGLWWNSNTVSHQFIHRPFFQSRVANRLFACYLTLVLGIPQTVWRDRHLAHHAGVPWKPRLTRPVLVEAALVLGLWTGLLVVAPEWFLSGYLAGYVGGLALCWLHGYYEHARGTVSHHGRLYNRLFLNDGYHVEHHARPSAHWTHLPTAPRAGAWQTSHWPPVLRWLDAFGLTGLERLALRSRLLRSLLLAAHERAFRDALRDVGPLHRVAVVGGGLFPRTVLVLRRLRPDARLVVIDADADHVEVARRFPVGETEFVIAVYDPDVHTGFDLVVIPLAYVGDRAGLYRHPPAPFLLVHDWLWRRRGARGTVVSVLLLKRLNLVAG